MSLLYEFKSGLDVVDLKSGKVFQLFRSAEPADKDIEYSEKKPYKIACYPDYSRYFTDDPEYLDIERSLLAAFAFHPDNKRMVVATGKEINLVDISSGKEDPRFRKHAEGVQSIAISPDGNLLAVVGFDFLRIWNFDSGELLNRFDIDEFYSNIVFFSPDGKTLFCRIWTGKIQRWSIKTWKELEPIYGSESIFRFTFDKDNQLLVGNSFDNLDLWDLKNHVRIYLSNLTYFNQPIGDLFISSEKQTVCLIDQNRIYLCDCSVIYEEIKKGRLIGRNGKLVLRNQSLKPKCFQSLKGHQSKIKTVKFSHDGKMIAGYCQENLVKIWDVETGQIVKTFQNYEYIRNIAFSPDNRSIAICFS